MIGTMNNDPQEQGLVQEGGARARKGGDALANEVRPAGIGHWMAQRVISLSQGSSTSAAKMLLLNLDGVGLQ